MHSAKEVLKSNLSLIRTVIHIRSNVQYIAVSVVSKEDLSVHSRKMSF